MIDAERDAEAQADAAAVKYEADKADAEAVHTAAVEAWSVKQRKACGLKPNTEIFPATKRHMIELCRVLVEGGLKVQGSATYPELPDDQDTKGLSTTDGCRYFVDSYVDAQNALGVKVRTRFRCSYDPTIGIPSYKVLP